MVYRQTKLEYRQTRRGKDRGGIQIDKARELHSWSIGRQGRGKAKVLYRWTKRGK